MIVVTLPWPDAALFPNRKGGNHWATFQRAKVNARLEGYAAAKAADNSSGQALTDRTPVRVVFARPNRIRRDIDGMFGAIKHHLDGIAQAIGVDDSIFRPVTIDECLDPQKRGYVTVEIGN